MKIFRKVEVKELPESGSMFVIYYLVKEDGTREPYLYSHKKGFYKTSEEFVQKLSVRRPMARKAAAK